MSEDRQKIAAKLRQVARLLGEVGAELDASEYADDLMDLDDCSEVVDRLAARFKG